MNFLILGDGPEEWAWAQVLRECAEHRLSAAYPGFQGMPDLPGGQDLDGALAVAGLEAVVVGGGPDLRAEGLRRAAAEGLNALVLHPPGENADPYYQVTLSRQETGSIILPDLPARLHPGMEVVRAALGDGSIGSSRVLRYEQAADPAAGDLINWALPRVLDGVRALLGEVEAVTATGDPPGGQPTEGLVVQLRGPGGRRAEVRLWAGRPEPARLEAVGTDGSLVLEFDPDGFAPARLIRKAAGEEFITNLDPWDPRAAMLAVFAGAVAGREVHPDLVAATRTLEIAEAAARSLKRGRTVDLHYEEVSEVGNFKSVMTSLGCLVLFGSLLALPLALAGPALGIGWTIYLAYAIPPALVLFAILQVLRFAMREGRS